MHNRLRLKLALKYRLLIQGIIITTPKKIVLVILFTCLILRRNYAQLSFVKFCVKVIYASRKQLREPPGASRMTQESLTDIAKQLISVDSSLSRKF